MGRTISTRLAAPDDPIFSTGSGVFSRLASNPSMTSSAKSTTGDTPVKSTAAAEQVDELEDGRYRMAKLKHQNEQYR